MKTCTKCKQIKDISQFNKKLVMKDGLSSHCKNCSRKLTNASYAKNPEYYKNNILKRRKKVKEIINNIKEKTPCSDCKKYYPSHIMDFDHRDVSQKSFGIANGTTLSFHRLMEEIKKCEIVCSNCHRERTYKRNACVVK